MTNLDFARIVRRTARMLEYREGRSAMTAELASLAGRVETLEVPLRLFSTVDLGDRRETSELEKMLQFWFGRFSRDAVWLLRETILTLTNPLLDRLQNDVSQSAQAFLKIESLPPDAIGYVRDRLRIRTVDQLKKACAAGSFAANTDFSEQDELDILEDILELEKQERERSEFAEKGLQGESAEILRTMTVPEVPCDDPNAMFPANAEALAEAIIDNLSSEIKGSILKTASDLVGKEALSAARDQAKGALGKAMRFFIPKSSPAYARMRLEERERERASAQRRAEAEAENFYENASNQPLDVEIVGALARGEEIISQLDFVVRTDDPGVAFDRIKKADFVRSVEAEEGNWLAVLLQPSFFEMPYNARPTPPVRLCFYATSEFAAGSRELVLTASREHWLELQRRAAAKGWTLTEVGLYDGPMRLSSRTAERTYEKLGLPEIPVELRSGTVGFAWAEQGAPELVELEDLRADLHMHTTYSDGVGDFDAMVDAAERLEYDYVAFTDHTQNAPILNGLDDDGALRYWDAVDALNENLRREGLPLRILRGVEVDILEHGGLDLRDSTLERAEWVVASIHVAREQKRDALHKRYMDALQNPYVDVIAHPTERVVGKEAPMKVDLEFLCENAKKYGKALELNSQPRRLDLGFKGLLLAKKYGVKIVVSTDAHAPEQMDYLAFGVEQARRAGLVPGDVLNTLSLDELMERRRRIRAGLAGQ